MAAASGILSLDQVGSGAPTVYMAIRSRFAATRIAPVAPATPARPATIPERHRLAGRNARSHAPWMFVVSEVEAAAIRAAVEQQGELANFVSCEIAVALRLA